MKEPKQDKPKVKREKRKSEKPVIPLCWTQEESAHLVRVVQMMYQCYEKVDWQMVKKRIPDKNASKNTIIKRFTRIAHRKYPTIPQSEATMKLTQGGNPADMDLILKQQNEKKALKQLVHRASILTGVK